MLAPLLTLGLILLFAVAMIVVYKSRSGIRSTWRNPYMPHPLLWRGAPDWADTPRPPWPIDEEGNPIEVDENDMRK